MTSMISYSLSQLFSILIGYLFIFEEMSAAAIDPSTEPPEKERSLKDEKYKEEYFKEDRFLFSQNCLYTIIFSWISPLLKYGSRFPLDQKAIPQLRPQHRSRLDFDRLSQSFSSAKKSKVEGLTLTKSIYRAFKREINMILLFSIVKTAFQMYSPILSHNVIDYISSPEQQKSAPMSLLYFCSIFLLTLLMALDTSYLFFYFGVLGFNLSNTLSLLVYNKALKHPLITEKKFTVADIINYSQVDAQRMTYMGFQMVALLFTPFQIVIGLYLLYLYIGPSFLVGTGVMVVLMVFTLGFSKIASRQNDKLLKAKDARMKLAEEILQIIKFIKINALEKYFFQKLNRKRENQLQCIRNVNTCYVVNVFVYWLCPPLIVSATFLLYSYEGNEITAAKAFITIIIFNILQYPIRLFPASISAFIQMWASIKRIQKFLHAEEITHQFVVTNPNKEEKYAVEIQHGYFLWGKEKEHDDDDKNKKKKKEKKNRAMLDEELLGDQNQNDDSPRKYSSESPKRYKQNSSTDDPENINSEDPLTQLTQSMISQSSIYIDTNSPTRRLKPPPLSAASQPQKQKSRYIKALQDINIKIPAKKITMIIGDIGSGKTSLLYAILNEMTPEPQRCPSIKIYGSIAFAPQKPWIMAGTVKENILFFNPYDEAKFKEVLHYACLEDDIKLFTNGIDTEIGEKGVNLSGGQKARISLARTLYADKDIYLLDDILSAVDVHVGKFLIEKAIMGYLKGKTIIMPTHAVKYLESADNIIIMKKGKIQASGPLKYVRDFEAFKEIMRHEKKKQEEEEEEEQKLAKQEEQIKKSQIMTKEVMKSFAQAKMEESPATEVETVEKVIEKLIMPEDHKVGEVSREVYWRYIKQNGGPLFLFSILFCLSVWTVLSTVSNIQIKQWCEDENKTLFHLYLYLGLAVSATLFSGIQSYILVLSGIRQGRTIHKQIIKALLYTSLSKFYNRVPMGRILNRLSKDLRELDETIGVTVGGTLVNLFCLIASLTMCIYGSTPWMVIPILLAGFACLKTKNYYLKSQRECVRLQSITNSPIVSGFTSTINGVGTIRAYHLEQPFLNHQISKIEKNKRMKISRSAMESWFALRLTFFSFFVNMSAIGFCILSGNQSAAIAGLLLTYSTVLSDDIINLAFTYANLEIKMISVERVSAFTEIEPELGYVGYCAKWRTKEEGSDLNAIAKGDIEFKNYSARYRDELPLAIKNISICIRAGDKVGIVGRTGAGKSTLISCLLRILEPSSGAILIDGRDIMSYRVKDLRSCMTMIEQEPTLMMGSFRDNLDPTCLYSDEEILGVLEECNLTEMVESKGGLDSRVSNEILSVGEKQLLCICRAFLKRSKIILVDEATANIDVKNDYLIQNLIAQKFKQSTVLTIAHRLTTLKDCDKILVLGEGRVLEWGSTMELLGSDSIYRRMCESNDKSYLD